MVRVESTEGVSVQPVSPSSQSTSSPETFPPPELSPVTVTSRVFVPGSGVLLKDASISTSLPPKLTVHLLAAAVQGPLHESKVQPFASFAVRTTDPLEEDVVKKQFVFPAPQVIWPLSEVTWPPPSTWT